MRLRALAALPSVPLECCLLTSKTVRTMKSRMLTASLGAILLMLAANETFAASRGSFHGGAHMTSHRLMAHSFRHHRITQGGYVWPGDDGYYGSTGAAVLDGTQPLPNDVGNSNASDIPWDWAHRYPPAVTPSGRPYVSTCGAETVTVPNENGGTGQVNIVRCY
jgi:hypothetical protein